MSMIPSNHPVRIGMRTAAGGMRLASFAANLLAVLFLAYWANRLIGMATSFFDDGGGWSFVSYIRQNAGNVAAIKEYVIPALHVRARLWIQAWFCGVFGVGCGFLAVAGLRSLYWQVHSALR